MDPSTTGGSMKESTSGKVLAMACVVLLAACADGATAPASQLQRLTGRLSAAIGVSPVLDSVAPLTATVPVGGTVQFTGWSNSTDTWASLPMTGLTWSVTGDASAIPPGDNAISTTGLFTAGTNPGPFTVSVFDPNGNTNFIVNAIVTVTAAPTCKSDDDKKACDKERDHEGNKGGKDHGNKDHGDKDHGDKDHGDNGHGN
jgi:hypothetical protein